MVTNETAAVPTATIPAEDFTQKIDNVIDGFFNYGYVVTSKPIAGQEAGYLDCLKVGLERVFKTVDRLHASAHCRGKSKRTMTLLHRTLPEPCWGVHIAAKL